MGSRTFQIFVVVLWLSTMGWLLASKVLPPLLVGEPPTLRETLPAEDQVVAWRLLWDGDEMGWAASRTSIAVSGITEVQSQVVIEDLSLEKLAPAWLRMFVRYKIGSIDVDATSRLEIDTLGQLSAVYSRVRLSELEDAITINGHVENGALNLIVRSGGTEYSAKKHLPSDALVASELSPQASMPGLRVGQTWTMPVFSPFRPPNSPMEILHARVEREEWITWNEKVTPVWLVVYRKDPGSGLATAVKPQGQMWVRRDGTVLQQEITIFNSQLRFVRMTDADAKVHSAKLDASELSSQPAKAPGAPNGR